MKQTRTKRNMFIIATSIFLVTMSTVFFLADKDKISVDTEHIQASVLHASDIDAVKDESGYRNLLENNEDAFAIVNADRTFRYLSDNLENTHGYTLDETEDINVLTFIHPKDLPTFGNSLIEYNQELETKSNIGPIRIKTKSGEYIPYMVTLVPIKTDEGKKAATAILLKDISTPLGEIYNPQPEYEETELDDTPEKIKAANDKIEEEIDEDNNNGHGNNIGRVDPSNPGNEKSHKNK